MLVAQMAEKEGETEKLKVQDQILWRQRMNCIRLRAEEIVREEIIYTFRKMSIEVSSLSIAINLSSN